MAVYILKPDETVFSVNRQIAIVGFGLRGSEVRTFEFEELDTLPLSRADTVVGGIGVVHGALRRLGLQVPTLPSIPDSLIAFAGRKIWTEPLIDVRRAVERGARLFVKPVPTEQKRFNGQPLLEFSDLLATVHLPDDLVVECADYTPFVSEFRTFVLHGEIIDFRHYKGDPLIFPCAETVRTIVTAYREAPAGCAIDIGVAEDGRTLLVEVNDGYAVGAYGLSPIRYAAMIDARWDELRRSEATGPDLEA